MSGSLSFRVKAEGEEEKRMRKEAKSLSFV